MIRIWIRRVALLAAVLLAAPSTLVSVRRDGSGGTGCDLPQMPRDQPQQASAPRLVAPWPVLKVDLDTLENHPDPFLGRDVTVHAEVQDVLGPHVFRIDEPQWADLESEVLVTVRPGRVALVRENDQVTVTGTVKSFLQTDRYRESAWLDLDDEIETDLAETPVISASCIIGATDHRSLLIDVPPNAAKTPISFVAADAITEVDWLARGDEELVGRPVALGHVKVDALAGVDSFFIRTGNTQLLVLTNDARPHGVGAGDVVALHGVVLQLPQELEKHVNAPTDSNRTIYLYVTSMKETSER